MRSRWRRPASAGHDPACRSGWKDADDLIDDLKRALKAGRAGAAPGSKGRLRRQAYDRQGKAHRRCSTPPCPAIVFVHGALRPAPGTCSRAGSRTTASRCSRSTNRPRPQQRRPAARRSVEALAGWTLALLDAAGAARSLHVVPQHGLADRARDSGTRAGSHQRLAMVGVSDMVSAALLASARQPLRSVDMVNAFSHAGIKPSLLPPARACGCTQPRADAPHARQAPAASPAATSSSTTSRVCDCDAPTGWSRGSGALPGDVRARRRDQMTRRKRRATSPRRFACQYRHTARRAFPDDRAPDGVLNAVRQALTGRPRADHARPLPTTRPPARRTAGRRRRRLPIGRWDRDAPAGLLQPAYLRWSGRTRDELFGHARQALRRKKYRSAPPQPSGAQLRGATTSLRTCCTARWPAAGRARWVFDTPT